MGQCHGQHAWPATAGIMLDYDEQVFRARSRQEHEKQLAHLSIQKSQRSIRPCLTQWERVFIDLPRVPSLPVSVDQVLHMRHIYCQASLRCV